MRALPAADDAPLVRALSTTDATLVTVGATLGTGIFLTTSAVAASAPDPRGILGLWLAGGLLAMTGALTYAELGAMFPRTGGQYVYLKEAYGPVWGFLFGWASFFVIMTGGVAVLAVGFGEYLGAFVPALGSGRTLWSLPLPFPRGAVWTTTGAQLSGAVAIVAVTAVHYVGVRAGTGFQNVVTAAKIAALAVLGVAGLLLPARPDTFARAASPFPLGLAAAGVGMIAVSWTYDGWYGATYLAGEMRRPERSVPAGLIAGTAIVTALYLLMNVVYLRALPVAVLRQTPRVAEASALALIGPAGSRLVAALVLVTTFGCLASTILYPPRIYLPMARDGVFFGVLGRVHPRYRTPAASLIAQAVWGIALAFSGTYEQLYTYVVFAVFLFHAATGAAVIVLRSRRPDAPRPYRTPLYPWVPLLFAAACLAFVANTLVEKPAESGIGLAILAAGFPAFLFWRRRAAAER